MRCCGGSSAPGHTPTSWGWGGLRDSHHGLGFLVCSHHLSAPDLEQVAFTCNTGVAHGLTCPVLGYVSSVLQPPPPPQAIQLCLIAAATVSIVGGGAKLT